jgi:hypothetical protein
MMAPECRHARTKHARQSRELAMISGMARYGTSHVTCDPRHSPRNANAFVTAGNTLLMRFGFTPIRGSNPRASALKQGAADCRGSLLIL